MCKILFKIDIEDWVLGTVNKYETGSNWDDSWSDTYYELGGCKYSVSVKGCPKIAAKTLYKLGRFKNTNSSYQEISFKAVCEKYSKNGMYSLMTLKFLQQNSNLTYKEVWEFVKNSLLDDFKIDLNFDQGAVKVAYRMWQLGHINMQCN